MGGDNHHGHEELTRDKLLTPKKDSFLDKYCYPVITGFIFGPVNWYKDTIQPKIQGKPYPYYHQRFARVPTIDTCFIDDPVCFVEANQQFIRDKLVDANIVRIMRNRKTECQEWYGPSLEEVDLHCADIKKQYEDTATNYFIKYGDLGYYGTVRDAYMKQKHRMLWERRHGPVGSKSVVEKGDEAAMKEDSMFSVLRKSFGRSHLPKELQ